MTDSPRNQILIGDALEQLQQLPSESVDMVLTSPPYYNLRNYQVGGQLGQEATIHEWVSNLTAVAGEVRRVLTPTGTFWLNVADRYSIHDKEGSRGRACSWGRHGSQLRWRQTDGWCATRSSGARPTPCRVASQTG